MGDALVQLSKLRKQIEAARDWDELRDIRDKSIALATYFKSIGERTDIANAAVEGRMRSERRMGEALAAMEKQRPGEYQRLHDETVAPTLSDIGISKTQSHRWQKLSAIPEDRLQSYIAACNSEGKELTNAGLLRFHNAIDKPDNGTSSKSDNSVASLLMQLTEAIRKQVEKWEPGYLSVLSDRLRSIAEEIDEHGGLPE